jgi:hypothetical protein
MDRNETFTEILERLKKSAHGTAELVELTEFLRGLKKEKRPFLQSRFIEAAISWDLNRSRGIWETDEEANKNIYWFLQGSIIESSHVLGPSGRSADLNWMVLSPDCDCARAEYINLGRLRQLSDSEADQNILSLASSLKSHRYFPVPPHGDVQAWSVVELDIPFYMERENRAFCKTNYWLSKDAWHILNAVLQSKHTRATNMSESERLRTSIQGIE